MQPDWLCGACRSFTILLTFLSGGFVLSKGSTHPWTIWLYCASSLPCIQLCSEYHDATTYSFSCIWQALPGKFRAWLLLIPAGSTPLSYAQNALSINEFK